MAASALLPLVRRHVATLQRMGNEAQTGVCPFEDHSPDAIPMFVVHNTDDDFTCFNCGKAGGVDEFLGYLRAQGVTDVYAVNGGGDGHD